MTMEHPRVPMSPTVYFINKIFGESKASVAAVIVEISFDGITSSKCAISELERV